MKKVALSNIIILLCVIAVAYMIFHDGNHYEKSQYDEPYEFKDMIDFPHSDVAESNARYYYEQLNETQKKIYDLLERECMKYQSSIKLNKANREDVRVASYALSMDYPEFFWIDQYTYKTINNNYVVEINYEVPYNVKEILESIDVATNQIFDEMKDANIENDYDELKFFYDWIVNHTDYGDVKNSQDIRSVFLEHTSVCAGYSRAFQYLGKLKNIECTYVVGYTKNNENHGWNLVKLFGKYYWVDVTWGDPVFAGEQDNEINYNFFLVDDDELFQNHVIEKGIKMVSEYQNTKEFSYPNCTDKSLNYYRLHHSLFEEYDKDAVSQYFRDKFYNNIYSDIELKFENKEDYDMFLYQYITGKNALIYEDIKAANRFFFGTMLVEYVTIESANYVKVSVELR